MSVGCRVNVNVNARNYTQSDQCEIMARVKEHLKNVEKILEKKHKKQSKKTNNKKQTTIKKTDPRIAAPVACRALHPV
jgi:hypothetical protein